MGPPSEILSGLWLANFESAQDKSVLKKLNITRVLTVGNRSPMDNSLLNADVTQETRTDDDGIVYKLVWAMDSTDQNLLKHFRHCFEFIDESIENKRGIMVHCHMGFSRSAALVIAYLMRLESLSYEKAFERVRKKRIVGPNSGFVRQLQMFERNDWDVERNYDDDYVLGLST